MMNNESIKEFLKPNHGKILVFLAIPVTLELCVFIIASILDCNNEFYCAIAGVPFLISLILGVILRLPALIFEYVAHIIYNSHNFHSLEPVLGYILLIFYWYFLSCIMLSLYKKFRRKKIKAIK